MNNVVIRHHILGSPASLNPKGHVYSITLQLDILPNPSTGLVKLQFKYTVKCFTSAGTTKRCLSGKQRPLIKYKFLDTQAVKPSKLSSINLPESSTRSFLINRDLKMYSTCSGVFKVLLGRVGKLLSYIWCKFRCRLVSFIKYLGAHLRCYLGISVVGLQYPTFRLKRLKQTLVGTLVTFKLFITCYSSFIKTTIICLDLHTLGPTLWGQLNYLQTLPEVGLLGIEPTTSKPHLESKSLELPANAVDFFQNNYFRPTPAALKLRF